MGGRRGLFTQKASEDDRNSFYRTMESIGVDSKMTKAPSRVSGPDRASFNFHGDTDEKKELRAVCDYFGTTEAAIIRICYRIGIGTLASSLSDPEDAAEV